MASSARRSRFDILPEQIQMPNSASQPIETAISQHQNDSVEVAAPRKSRFADSHEYVVSADLIAAQEAEVEAKTLAWRALSEGYEVVLRHKIERALERNFEYLLRKDAAPLLPPPPPSTASISAQVTHKVVSVSGIGAQAAQQSAAKEGCSVYVSGFPLDFQEADLGESSHSMTLTTHHPHSLHRCTVLRARKGEAHQDVHWARRKAQGRRAGDVFATRPRRAELREAELAGPGRRTQAAGVQGELRRGEDCGRRGRSRGPVPSVPRAGAAAACARRRR